jgi:hypothetical protein
VACRKIVLADVVSLLATTKRISVAAYATDTSAVRGRMPRRASGSIRASATAAIPDRTHATCQPVIAVALMTAPPVEKRTAAATS